MSTDSSIFCTSARTHPITFKLYQIIEDVILIKNNEKKIGNIYGPLAKIVDFENELRFDKNYAI